MVDMDCLSTFGAIAAELFFEASEQARKSSPAWHVQFEELGVDPDPDACLYLAATSPVPLLAGFLFGQAAAVGLGPAS